MGTRIPFPRPDGKEAQGYHTATGLPENDAVPVTDPGPPVVIANGPPPA